MTTNGDQIEQINCLPCGKGKFTPYKGLWKNCVDCPVDLTSGDDTSKGCAGNYMIYFDLTDKYICKMCFFHNL